MATSSPVPSSPQSSQPPFSDDDALPAEEQEDNDVDNPLLDDGQATPDEEEEEGEDLMGDDMERDYREIAHLDTYEEAGLDEEEQEELDPAARRALEKELAARDRRTKRGFGRRLIPGLEGDEGSEDESEAGDRPKRRRLHARVPLPGDEDDVDYDEREPIIENLEDRKGHSLREWVLLDPPNREIFRQFKSFLTTYVNENGVNVHAERIKAMCLENRESLHISYTELCSNYPVLAIFVADAPTEVLAVFDRAAKEVVLESYPDYEQIKSEIHVRITDLPVRDEIRSIRQMHLNALIKVGGVVTRRTGIFPELKLAKFNCDKCNATLGPFLFQDALDRPQLGQCPECQSKGPFSLNTEETVYRNHQRITIQESPGSVPAGRLPRQKEVILLWDLVDSVKPGDEIEVTGIYRNNFDQGLNVRHGFPVFSTLIEANYIEKRADKFSQFALTDEDKALCLKLSKEENIGKRLLRSMAPSIYGHEDIKLAMALALFGGEAKLNRDQSRVRGDINVLLLGDPGTAKSQFLKYVQKVAPRAVFTTGQGASAVGLTASVQKDPLTREWTLQGGALVLADQGVCLIDEFDKMNDQDRTSIHEAMEQQSISVSKAGIVTSLQARCAVIAAANPIRGKYQPGITFSQNVDLTEPILSRFDILCVVKDVVDPVQDENLARFVVGSHMRSHPTYKVQEDDQHAPVKDPLVLSQEVLKKYILYAKQNVHPKLVAGINEKKIEQVYVELRRAAQETGSIPITVRYLDSLLRIAQAYARMHLRTEVDNNDVDMAIRVVVSSFIETQRHSVMRTMQRKFQKYITYNRDNSELAIFVLSQLVRENLNFYTAKHGVEPSRVEVGIDEFRTKLAHMNVRMDLETFLASPEFTNWADQNGFFVEEDVIVRSL